MRYGIFSDIHANLQAFEAIMTAYEKEGIDQYFCGGDVVGYGANPHECIERLRDIPAVCIAGNHDWAVVDRVDIGYFNSMAKAAILWTRKYSSREDMAFLDHLKLVSENEDFILVHGTLENPAYFDYLMDPAQALETFRLMDRDICFVGHSHVAGVFIKEGERIRYSPSVDTKITNGYRYIVNVGSVGQPRDGDPRAAYCVYDTQEKTIRVKRIHYDIEEAQRRILEVGLPAFLARRLASGR